MVVPSVSFSAIVGTALATVIRPLVSMSPLVIAAPLTLPAVAMVASLVSTIAAEALMLSLSITLEAIVTAIEAPLERFELTLPVASPVKAKVRTLERLVAVAALPVQLAELPVVF